jgi:hypothetical protein
MMAFSIRVFLLTAAAWLGTPLFAQSLGNAGTIEGTVLDQTGAAVQGAAVHLVRLEHLVVRHG